MLLVFFGQIGSGKTSLAKRVAEKLGCELVYFDNMVWVSTGRKNVYGDKGEFLLDEEETQKVYDSMHKRAKELLKSGKNVVLESMYFKKQREQAMQTAKQMNSKFALIEVVCDENITRQRLEKRSRENPQTPRFELYLQYKGVFEPEEKEHITIDTSNKSVEECSEEVIKKLNP